MERYWDKVGPGFKKVIKKRAFELLLIPLVEKFYGVILSMAVIEVTLVLQVMILNMSN